MILAIAIAAAVTFGLWAAYETFNSRWMVSAICETTLLARRNPETASRFSATQIYAINRAIGGVVSVGIGVMAGLAMFGLGAILVLASPAHAEPSPCMPAALQMAFTKAPGIQVQRITREGSNLAAVVEAFLANAGAPDLNTEDFILSVDAEARDGDPGAGRPGVPELHEVGLPDGERRPGAAQGHRACRDGSRAGLDQPPDARGVSRNRWNAWMSSGLSKTSSSSPSGEPVRRIVVRPSAYVVVKSSA